MERGAFQNLTKHQTLSILKPISIFEKRSILDVWQISEYATPLLMKIFLNLKKSFVSL